MRILFIILLGLHAFIHSLGFIKAFRLSEIKALTSSISKFAGISWGIACTLFAITLFLFFSQNATWWIVAIFAVLISQALIITYWQDAKYGTIINVIVLIIATIGYGQWNFERKYRRDVDVSLLRSNFEVVKMLTKNDVTHLPMPVQRYLHYVGVVNKPRINNMRVLFEGQMRGKNQDWFKFSSEQYSFYDVPERFFFMKAKVKGLPTDGYHFYKTNSAGMQVKLLSLFSVVDLSGKDLYRAETVTLFNDMCLMAPAALIDKRIHWTTINEHCVQAKFTNHDISITALLYFNEQGQLINFVSEDRFDISDMTQRRFSTPVSNYQNINGYKRWSYAEAIWHYPEEKFVYGKFNLKSISYNVDE